MSDKSIPGVHRQEKGSQPPSMQSGNGYVIETWIGLIYPAAFRDSAFGGQDIDGLGQNIAQTRQQIGLRQAGSAGQFRQQIIAKGRLQILRRKWLVVAATDPAFHSFCRAGVGGLGVIHQLRQGRKDAAHALTEGLAEIVCSAGQRRTLTIVLCAILLAKQFGQLVAVLVTSHSDQTQKRQK